ncbi:uncharacterized protein [Rutidosis leptorrhynchoides]|uniref:uncharacterized protein n=1 Tax=Rutidosis leptorrhynchoides TaxID=125765 RepID=UPI003A9902F7
MSATTYKSPSSIKFDSRKILGPAGNRVKVKEDDENLKKNVTEKKTKSCVKLASRSPQIVGRKKDESVDSSCSSKSCSSKSSSSNNSSVKIASLKKREKRHINKMKLEPSDAPVPFKRCDWITQFSDPLHVTFHDEEWGVPVLEDGKLFELLVLSLASAELTWPEILYKRDKFRKVFDNFNPSYIAKFPDDNLLLLARKNGIMLLSEQKMRAIVENAIAFIKIQQEFGSFSSYFWRFLNKRPIKNQFRYARQVPAKTPKSELISKDLMKRGFRCVGPTIVYSFMQISGMVNDHLISCFRHIDCSNIDLKSIAKETKQELDNLYDTKLSHE